MLKASPADLRSAAKQKISLSTLTMPHEFARVVLAEQIYRAFRDSCRTPLSGIAALLRKYRHVHQDRSRQSRARLIR